MNYKLAKQIKDAGFPQDEINGALMNYWDGEPVETVYVPTLSELIDACGSYLTLSGRGTWLVTAPMEKISEAGNSPEEAVAKLWLKLN